MKINYMQNGIIQIDEARIIHRNFSGVGSQFNREGDRNFSVVISDERIADELIDQGWNVKVRAPRDPDEKPLMFLPVKIKFNARGPAVYLKSDGNLVKLDEESVSRLDNVDIVSVDMDIRPYDWKVNGKTGRSAYLQSICVTQNVDRFMRQYGEEESPEEDLDEPLPF